MKADQMRFIYECLAGANGLLVDDYEKKSFIDDIKKVESDEINVSEEILDNPICNPNYYNDEIKWDQNKRNAFYSQEMTLLDFMEHEVVHEYEKAKRALLEKDMVSATKIKSKEDGLPQAPFHPIYLSAMMNQQVFMREVCIQKAERKKAKALKDG